MIVFDLKSPLPKVKTRKGYLRVRQDLGVFVCETHVWENLRKFKKNSFISRPRFLLHPTLFLGGGGKLTHGFSKRGIIDD